MAEDVPCKTILRAAAGKGRRPFAANILVSLPYLFLFGGRQVLPALAAGGRFDLSIITHLRPKGNAPAPTEGCPKKYTLPEKKSPAIAWKAGGSVFLYGSGKVPSQGISSLWMSSSQKESSAELPQATLKLASCWLSPKLSARREPFRAFSAFAATWAELSAPS